MKRTCLVCKQRPTSTKYTVMCSSCTWAVIMKIEEAGDDSK